MALSWRGDGKFLAVLAPEAPEGTEGANGAPQPSLVLRIYDREAGLTPHAKGRRAEDDGAVEGLVPGAVAWSTDGALIATARATGRKGKAGAMAMEVAFFERNGLRHRELALREGEEEEGAGAVEVGALAWDAEAGVLAVALLPSTAPGPPPRVQLWHRGNYHWYLKQELRLGSSGPAGGATQLLALRFDAERARRLHVLVSRAQQQEQGGQQGEQIEWRTLDFCWDALLSPSPLRTAAVVDGRRLLLTPLSQAVVPPPMAAATLEAAAPVTAVGFSAHATPPLRYHPHGGQQSQAAPAAGGRPVAVMAVLTATGTVEVYDERRAAAAVGEGERRALLGWVVVDAAVEARQVAVLVEGKGKGGDGTLLRLRLLLAGWHRRQGVEGVLALGVTAPVLPSAKDAPLTITQQAFHPLPPSDGHSTGVLRLQPWGQRRDAALLALEDGRVLQYTCLSSSANTNTSTNGSLLAAHPHVLPLLEPCPWVHLLDLVAPNDTDHPIVLVGLSERGRLYANEHCLAPGGCGSFLPHPSFGLLLYATLGSRPQLRLVPYRALARLDAHAGAEAVLEAVGEGMEVVEPRALERGARLVAASPVAPTVVLQVGR